MKKKPNRRKNIIVSVVALMNVKRIILLNPIYNYPLRDQTAKSFIHSLMENIYKSYGLLWFVYRPLVVFYFFALLLLLYEFRKHNDAVKI
jgi:hypothetical protein